MSHGFNVNLITENYHDTQELNSLNIAQDLYDSGCVKMRISVHFRLVFIAGATYVQLGAEERRPRPQR